MITLRNDSEIALWSRVYASTIVDHFHEVAREMADQAVENFRARLPKNALAGEMDRLEKMAFKAVHTI